MTQAEPDLEIIERCKCVVDVPCGGRGWKPLESHDDCQAMIDEVGRRGLWGKYYDVLLDRPFHMTPLGTMKISLTATPRQKAMAALEVLERKEEQ